MSVPKMQIVFAADGRAEIQIMLDGRPRMIDVDLSEALFSPVAFNLPEVRAALHAWIVAAKVPVWMSLADVDEALAAKGISIDVLVDRYPPRFLENLA